MGRLCVCATAQGGRPLLQGITHGHFLRAAPELNQDKAKLWGDVFEALVAVVYFDSGAEATRQTVGRWLAEVQEEGNIYAPEFQLARDAIPRIEVRVIECCGLAEGVGE